MPRRGQFKSNVILEDNGDWLLIDISTNKFPGSSMAIDSDVWNLHSGARVRAFTDKNYKYIRAAYHNRGATTYLHKDVIRGSEIDHIIHGSMSFVDNRASNLRSVTHSQNLMNQGIRTDNKSGTTGVCWSKRNGKWRSSIKKNGKQIHLGDFDNIEFAIGARQQAEKEFFGEFANVTA